MFQIVQGSPVHCQITDGIVGSGYRRLPMMYLTEGCAQAIAGRLHRDDYKNCGDDWFYVIRSDEDPLNKFGHENRVLPPADASDDCPF